MHIPIIVDRIEDGFATLVATVPAEDLPEDAREGDVLYCDGGGRLQIDVEQTRKRRENTRELFERLLDKG